MHQDSIYRKMIDQASTDLEVGYNYKSTTLVDKFVSPALSGNPRLGAFITKLNDYFVTILDLIKYFQFYNNFTIDKNDKRYNT
jgi:hypothetical protein